MATTKRATATKSFDVPYAPDTWSAEQLAFHRADCLDAAFKNASCLAGGWYHRAVTMDYSPDERAESGEAYMLRPSEVAPLPGWMPCYEVRKVS
jgi:hypothetical protein